MKYDFGTKFKVPQILVPNLRSQTSGTKYNCRYQIFDTKFNVPNFGTKVST